MTLGDALQISNLTTGGGHLLVLFDCGVNEHYWPPNGCSGFRNVTEGEERKTVEYVCYNNSDSKGFPLGRMFGYLENVGRKVAPSSGYLYQLQVIGVFFFFFSCCCCCCCLLMMMMLLLFLFLLLFFVLFCFVLDSSVYVGNCMNHTIFVFNSSFSGPLARNCLDCLNW